MLKIIAISCMVILLSGCVTVPPPKELSEQIVNTSINTYDQIKEHTPSDICVNYKNNSSCISDAKKYTDNISIDIK
jgi:starvation-inducible outer membrane lipoprotein